MNREDIKMLKIEVIELEDKYLYKFGNIIYNEQEYLMNNKPLQDTFVSDWYVADEMPNLLQKKETQKINEKWKLKNEDLYNETIPLIVDKHSKQKYKKLVESDLYEYTYDEKEVLKEIPLEIKIIGVINDNVPIEHKEIYQTGYGWYSTEKKERYLIKNVGFSIKDNCLTPSPIKQLTKPCMLNHIFVYQILTDYIRRNIDYNYAKIAYDGNYTFRIKTKGISEVTILNWSNDEKLAESTLKDLYAKNFKELVKKLENMKKETIDYINKQHICPYCNGTGCSTEIKLDVYKWFEKWDG